MVIRVTRNIKLVYDIKKDTIGLRTDILIETVPKTEIQDGECNHSDSADARAQTE